MKVLQTCNWGYDIMDSPEPAAATILVYSQVHIEQHMLCYVYIQACRVTVGRLSSSQLEFLLLLRQFQEEACSPVKFR